MRKVHDITTEMDGDNYMDVWNECKDRGLIRRQAE